MNATKQVIISIGREFGSGGHVIAEALARRLELPIYDSNLLHCVAQEKNVDHSTFQKYDEAPKSKLFSRTVRGHSNSPHQNLAAMQFDYLKKLASEGQSFVVVGRCSETILRDFPGLISFFISGDEACKIRRVKEVYGVSGEEAKRMMQRADRKRKSYHDYYCEGGWGSCRTYDVCLNSSRLGLDGTVDAMENYISLAINNKPSRS